MTSDPASAYKSTQIETASQGQILLMLYDGAIQRMKQARDALEKENYEVSHSKLVKAQDIVTELMATLDMDIGGEIAENLYNLYDYILHNLVQANVQKEADLVAEVIPVMGELYGAWQEIINKKGMTIEKARSQVSQNIKPADKSESNQQSSETPESIPKKSSNKSQGDPRRSDTDGSSGSTSAEDSPYGNISIQG